MRAEESHPSALGDNLRLSRIRRCRSLGPAEDRGIAIPATIAEGARPFVRSTGDRKAVSVAVAAAPVWNQAEGWRPAVTLYIPSAEVSADPTPAEALQLAEELREATIGVPACERRRLSRHHRQLHQEGPHA